VKRGWLHLFIAVFLINVAIGYWWWEHWWEHRFDRVILAAARQYGVEPALVKAVVWRESGFNPRARGKAGEIGLMQIREAAAKEWSNTEHSRILYPGLLFDPDTNTKIGAWYLSKLIKRYAQTDNPRSYALADYNAGRSNVLRWIHGAGATNSAVFLSQISFPSTRKYVADVLSRYSHYRPQFSKSIGGSGPAEAPDARGYRSGGSAGGRIRAIHGRNVGSARVPVRGEGLCQLLWAQGRLCCSTFGRLDPRAARG
jgi:soluble lytic murein transglycosylase